MLARYAAREWNPASDVGRVMNLEGIHHVTCITGDAPANVDFYTRVLGLRLVKKTVNQDDPTVYHLFYADEDGSAGSDLTFFEYPGAARGRAGAGMVHTVVWRVGSEDAFDFWAERLGSEGVEVERTADGLAFADPEGLRHELVVADVPDAPLVADHPEVPSEHALQGFHAVRAYTADPERSRQALEDILAFRSVDDSTWEARGDDRGGFYVYDQPPEERGLQGAGTVHHVAWASPMDEHEAWREQAAAWRAPPHAGHRPLLLPLDLLPRAERRSLRDRDARPGVRRGRGSGAPRRAALAAAEVRASPRADRTGSTPIPSPRPAKT